MPDNFAEQPKPETGAELALRTAQQHDREQASRGFVGELLNSAAYSGIQAPLQGVSQIVDGVAGTKLTEKVTFMERPREASSIADWHAQQLGGALGMVPAFLAIHKGVNAGMNRVLGTTAAESVGMMSMKRAVAEGALTGAIYEGVLLPSAPGSDLLSSRMAQTLKGGLTFGTLTAGARTLHDFGVVKNRVAASALSGLPAGFVSTQAESLLHGKGLASVEDTAKGMYGFAMVGGVFGAVTSLPMGERGKATETRTETKTETAEVKTEAKSGQPQTTEFRIDEAGRRQLDAFRRGEKETAWVEVQRAGEPKRTLAVGHETMPVTLATRADFIALCNLPEISPFARKLALSGATERNIFMDMPGEGRVRFSTEALSPEAIALGVKENLATVKTILSERGIDPETVPSWIGNWKPTGEVWDGANSVVIDLGNRPGMPEVVLKVKRADFEGNRWYEADIIDRTGKVNDRAVHETVDSANDSPIYMFLESRHEFDPVDASGYSEFMTKLSESGIVLEPGSGPPVGKDVNTGRWSVTDRDASSRAGSGEHAAERAAGLGREEYERQMEIEENNAGKDSFDEGHRIFEMDAEVQRARAGESLRLSDAQTAEATKLFGKTPMDGIRALLKEMQDADLSRDDVVNMQQWAVNGGDGAITTKQVKFVADLIREHKIPAADWVRGVR